MLQKNKGYEQPISFYNKSLQATKLKYNIMEKQVYALFKAIKKIRSYLVGAKVIDYVPNAAVKDIFVQIEIMSRRCRWINKIQDLNIDIQITKLVKGMGLEKLMVEENLEDAHVNVLSNSKDIIRGLQRTPWYKDIIFFLTRSSYPKGFMESQKRTLKLKS